MKPGGSQSHPLEQASLQSSAPTAVQADGAGPAIVRTRRVQSSESGPRDPLPRSSVTDSDRIVIGDLIAERYEVSSLLGEGGMGVVYRCRDRHRGVDVALKQVTVPEGSSTRDYLAWFYKEARALASLDHPGIVHATDFGQLLGGSPYLVMEFVTGSSLHDLGHVQLSYPVIWSIADQILDALAHAHARRVIHGDLKPSNVIIETRPQRAPRVHILDLGLAWLKEDPHDERLDGAKAMEFLPHAGAGTPGYMAPEQIQHEMHHVCGATDLYALGCLLYRLLGARAPFIGDTKELLHQHAYEAAPLLVPAIEVPGGVPEFVRRLLAKRPWDRYEFAAEARRAWNLLAPPWPLPATAWDVPEIEPSAPAAPRRSSTRPPRRLRANSERPTGLLSIRPSPLVGRQDIRSRLLQIARQVANGEGPPHRLVLLLGPAGVGKSRIAEWLTTAVHEEGRLVPLPVRYQRMRSASSGMLGAVVQYFNFERVDRCTIEESLLTRWGGGEADGELRAWIAGAAEWLRPTPPGTEQRLGPTGVRFRVDSPGVRRQITRFTIRKIANGRPLLFFLDDLHNASEMVVDGLLRIHETEQDQRIFMVATVRTEDVQLSSPIANALRLLRSELDGEVLQVLPMNREDTCSLLRASLPLDDEAVLEAARRSRGFPLFALQQLHAWAHAGDLKFEDGTYRVPREVLDVRPQTTADLWDARLAALSAAEQLAACAVATLGIDMRVVVLVALLADLGLQPGSCIDALRRAEIILPRGSERYTWPHALLQEHLLLRLQRRPNADQVFEAAARALEHHPLVGTHRVVRQRVINLLSANRPDAAADIFFEFLEQSSHGTLQPRATLDDLDLFEGRLTGASGARHDRWRAEVLRQAGSSLSAKEYAERAREVFAELDDIPNLAHCQRVLGQIHSNLGNVSEGLRLAEQALSMFERVHDVLGMAQSEAAVAEIAYLQGNYERARSAAERGATHFADQGRLLGRGQCLLLSCWIAHSEGRTSRARRLTLEARAELERSGYRPGLAETTLLLAHIEHRLSNFFSAMREGQEALGLFEALGMPRGAASCERLLAMVAVDTDDLDNAFVHAGRSLRFYEMMREPSGQSEAELLMAQVHLARGELSDARPLLERVGEKFGEERGPRQHYLLSQAWLELELGDVDQAHRALGSAANCFSELCQAGEHTSQLLARLSRLRWPGTEALDLIEEWRRAIDDHERRDQD
jgi:serine/threonine protein kinase/tetratricopeptide (TPR) repeat protein